MSSPNITRFFTYLRDALSGLGILYVLHLGNWVPLTVGAFQLTTAQAQDTADVIYPAVAAKREEYFKKHPEARQGYQP